MTGLVGCVGAPRSSWGKLSVGTGNLFTTVLITSCVQDKCFKTQKWRAREEECGSLLFNLMKTRIENAERLKQQVGGKNHVLMNANYIVHCT